MSLSQLVKSAGAINYAVVDLGVMVPTAKMVDTAIAVASRDSGLPDHVGAFAVTASLGLDELALKYQQARDDYSSILVKALADRLAEAFAECLHARVRREWGYGASEHLSNDDLIAEKYRGIRPAFG